MIMWLSLDDLVCFPDLVVDIWEDQVAHSVLSQAAPTMTTISALPQSCLLNRCPRPWHPRPRFSSRKTRANTARKHGGIPGNLPRPLRTLSDLRIQPQSKSMLLHPARPILHRGSDQRSNPGFGSASGHTVLYPITKRPDRKSTRLNS